MNKLTYFLLACMLVFGFGACSDDDQLMTDVDTIRRYLDVNGLIAEEDNSGLFYTIVNEGTGGGSPEENDIVEVEYEGRLLDGTVVDVTPAGTTRNFLLSNLLEGWKIGIPKLTKGGEITLYIPSTLAYGENARIGIPENSILIFDIKLVDFADTQLEFDDRKILEYLDANSLTAEKHESGLYYIIEEPGSEEKPNSSSEVLVNYKGYLLDGSVFDETTDNAVSFSLTNLINAWRIGIPLIGSGGKITLITPSYLAYGGSARTGIPANSVLVFEIELKNFQ